MPLSNEQLAELSKPIRNLKFMCGALLSGVCVLGVILCTIVDLENLNITLKMLVAMAAATGAVMYFTSFIAFTMLANHTDSRSDNLRGHFRSLQVAWIVRFAIIEGACVLNLMVTLLDNSLITLFVALVGVLLMVIGFPRTIKVEELLEERMK